MFKDLIYLHLWVTLLSLWAHGVENLVRFPRNTNLALQLCFFLVFVQQQWGVENFILFFKVLWSKTGFPVVPGEFPGPIEIVFVFLEFLLGSLNERKLERLPKIGISYEMEKPLWGDILGHAYIL